MSARSRLGMWVGVATVVVLATRAIVYALAPQSVLLAALAHNQVGPDVTVPVALGTCAAAAVAATVLWLAVVAVRERLALEGRALAAPPRLRPELLAARVVALFLASSLAFALLESTSHWREGLGWHGLHCLTGPVHRDAIPVLAGLSLVAVAVHGAIEHLYAWARRLVAQLVARLQPSALPAAGCALPAPRRQLQEGTVWARGPPAGALASYVPLS